VYTAAYSNPVSLTPTDVALIGKAAKTLDIAAYSLTDPPVIQAIALAAQRGVRVRIYLDRNELAVSIRATRTIEASPIGPLLTQSNIAIKVKESTVLMHLKSYCVDAATLRDGSANLTRPGDDEQDNSLTQTDDPAALAAFQSKFEAMWSRADNLSPFQITVAQQTFHVTAKARR